MLNWSFFFVGRLKLYTHLYHGLAIAQHDPTSQEPTMIARTGFDSETTYTQRIRVLRELRVS